MHLCYAGLITFITIHICPRHPGSRESIRRRLAAFSWESNPCRDLLQPPLSSAAGRKYHCPLRVSSHIAAAILPFQNGYWSLILTESSRILWSCSRGSADPGTKVPDECVFSCQCSPKRFLSSPIGLFFGKNEP